MMSMQGKEIVKGLVWRHHSSEVRCKAKASNWFIFDQFGIYQDDSSDARSMSCEGAAGAPV